MDLSLFLVSFISSAECFFRVRTSEAVIFSNIGFRCFRSFLGSHVTTLSMLAILESGMDQMIFSYWVNQKKFTHMASGEIKSM